MPTLTIQSGQGLSATPRMRLPSGTITFVLQDGTAVAAGQTVTIYVIEGGGGFPGQHDLESSASLQTDASGVVTVPDFVLGPDEVPNRLLVQADSTHAVATVVGSYSNTRIVAINPASGTLNGLCHDKADVTVAVQDQTFPNAPISKCPVMLEVSSGGGWVSYLGNLFRAVILPTEANSQIQIAHQYSSREETSTLRAILLEGPQAPPFSITANARRPRLLSSGSATRDETVAPCSTNWLSMMVRMGSSDSPADVVLGGGVKAVSNIEIQARLKSGQSDLFPPPGAPNFGSLLSAALRPTVAGDYSWEFWEPDYPDDPVRSVRGTATDRLSGAPLQPAGPNGGGIYVQTFGGGTRDDAYGLEILSVPFTDAQIQLPNSPSEPFQIDVVLTPIPSGKREIDEVDVKFKVHTTPGNSAKDDATAVGQTPGLVSKTPNGGDDSDVQQVTNVSGTTRLKAFFLANQMNLDHVVEVSARVKYRDLVNGVWVPHEDQSAILARAVFFRPRVYFTREDAPQKFVRIDDRAILPATVVDPSGVAITPQKDREIYLECIAPHVDPFKAQVVCGNASNQNVEMEEQTTTGVVGEIDYKLYRSKKPIVFYLESPDAFPSGRFTLPDTHYFLPASPPYLVTATLIEPFPNNPLPVSYGTPNRPTAFLNLLPAYETTPVLPEPRIDLPDLNTASDIHQVVRNSGDVVLKFKGVVHDFVADQVQAGAAGIKTVKIAGTDVAVTQDQEDVSVLRPFAWKGTFEGQAKLQPGPNVIELVATNLLGGTATRTLFVELYDPRNDYSNPDVTPMQARVRFGAEPEHRQPPRVMLAQYRVPHVPQGAAALRTTSTLTLNSVVTGPAVSVEDTVQLQLTHVNSTENIYVSQPVLVLPRSVAAAAVQAARAAGVTLLYHSVGNRMRAWNDALPHPTGDQSFQCFSYTQAIDVVRLMMKTASGFQETDHLSPDDVFTVEAMAHNPAASTFVQLDIAACDRLGRLVPGNESHRTLFLDKTPASGDWSRLMAVDLQPQPKNTDNLTAITLNADPPTDPKTVLLRVAAGGGVRVENTLGTRVPRIWPVYSEPARQQVEGSPAPQESPHGNSPVAGVGVVVGTGEVVLRESDAALHSRALPLRFVRTYRGFSDYDGPMGQNWTHNWNAWLLRISDDQYLFVDGDGQTVRFTRRPAAGGAASSTFDPEPGFYLQLVERSKRDCRLQWAGGMEQVFLAQSAGYSGYLRLTAVFDRVRNRIGLTYSQAGILANLEDSLGQHLYLRYEAGTGCLAAVGDFAKRLWSYGYYDGKMAGGAKADLKSVATPAVSLGPDPKPGGNQHTFTYEVAARGAKRHKVNGHQDPNGTASQGGPNPLPVLLSINYDDNGRVNLQTLDLMQIVFTRNWPEVDLIDRGGHSKKFVFTGNPGDRTSTLPQSLIETDQGVDHTTILRYNSQFETDRFQSPMGTVRERSYADQDVDPRNRGNLMSLTHFPTPGRDTSTIQTIGITDFTTDPSVVTPPKLQWSYTYEARFQQVKTSSDPRGATTTYIYDYETGIGRQDGNIVEAHAPVTTSGVLGGGTQQRITRYQYNNFGQPIQELDPDFVVTTTAYYSVDSPGSGATVSDVSKPTGFLAQTIHDATPANPNRSPTLVDAKPSPESYTYDIFGTYQSLTNPRTKTTQFTYNELGELAVVIRPDGGQHTYFHDPNGQMSKRVEVVKDNLPQDASPAPDKSITDRFEHDRLGRLTLEVIDDGGLNLTTERKYDGNGNLESIYSPVAKASVDQDRFRKFVYDQRDRCTQEISAPNVTPQWTITYTYDDDGNPLTRTDAQNIAETYTYDAWGHRIRIQRSVTLDLPSSTGTRYREQMRDALGNVARVTMHGSITGSTGDDQDLGQQLVYYDEASRVVATVDQAYRWVQSASGWSQTTIGSGRRIQKIEYDSAGYVAAVEGPRPSRVTSLFTGQGRQAKVTDPQTGETTLTYDENLNLLSVTYPGPALASGTTPITLHRTYDEMDRLATSETPGGFPLAYYYDTRGNMRLYVDPLGNRTFGEYDNAGRLISVKREMRVGGRRREAGATDDNRLTSTLETRHTYDENGNQKSVIYNNVAAVLTHTYGPHDERKTTTVAEDAFPSLHRDDNPGPETYSYEYLLNRLVDTITTPDKLVIKHEYNDGQLSRRTVLPKPGVAPAPVVVGTTEQLFTYDGAGRCVRMKDDNGVPGSYCETLQHFDSLNNIWEDQQSDPGAGATGTSVVSSEFRETGDLSLMKYQSNGPSIHYSIDPSGRLAFMSEFANYTFQPNSNYLSTRKYPSDLMLDLYFYPEGRLQAHLHDSHGDPLTAIQGERIDAYDEAGMVVQVGDVSQKEVNINYYDSLHRLGVVHQGIDPAKPKSDPKSGVWTGFDDRGNIVSLESGSINGRLADGRFDVTATRDTHRVLNLVNQVGQSVEQVDAQGNAILQTNVFQYDRRGNMISEPGRTYSYDVFGRLRSVSDTSGEIASFMYDVLGRRLHKKTASDTRRFIYNGHKMIEEVSASSGDRKRYFYSAEGLVGYEVQPAGAAAVRYYVHEDRTGSAASLTDSSGNVIERYTYDPFGYPQVYDALWNKLNPGATKGLPILNQGQYYDQELGLYCVGSRYYHPQLQRMLQRDPIWLDVDSNAYTYAHGNLQNYRDPTGNFVQLLVAAGIGTAFAISFYLAHKLARYYIDGDKTAQIKGSELLWAGVEGAVLGAAAALIIVIPGMIVVLPALAIGAGVSAGEAEIHEGRYGEAAVDFAGAILAAVGLYLWARGAAAEQPLSTQQKYFRGRDQRLRAMSNKAVGDAGEAMARALVEKLPNVKRVVSIQNKSNQGLDLAAEYQDGTWEFFDAKTGRGNNPPELTDMQQRVGEYVIDVLVRATKPEGIIRDHAGGWDPEIVSIAKEILGDLVHTEQLIHGRLIEIRHFGRPYQKITMRPWVPAPGAPNLWP